MARGDHLETLLEAIADGSHRPDAAEDQHLASCVECADGLARARAIESWLASREPLAPSASFTNAVMARVGQERWRTERVLDLGFNLAIAAGILVFLAAAAGLAWSLGFVTVMINLDALWQVVGAELTGRLMTQLQTIVMAAVILTMTLVLWWWAEHEAAS